MAGHSGFPFLIFVLGKQTNLCFCINCMYLHINRAHVGTVNMNVFTSIIKDFLAIFYRNT
jgi:hypothetical protein